MVPPKGHPNSSVDSNSMTKRLKPTVRGKNEKIRIEKRLRGIEKKMHELSVLCGVEACFIYLPPHNLHNNELEGEHHYQQQQQQFRTWPKDEGSLLSIIDRYHNCFEDGVAEKKQGKRGAISRNKDLFPSLSREKISGFAEKKQGKRGAISRNKDLFPSLSREKISGLPKKIEESRGQQWEIERELHLLSDTHFSIASFSPNFHEVGFKGMPLNQINDKPEVVENSREFLNMNQRIVRSECQNLLPGTPSCDDEEYEKMMAAVFEDLPSLEDSRTAAYYYCGLHVGDLISLSEFEMGRYIVDFA